MCLKPFFKKNPLIILDTTDIKMPGIFLLTFSPYFKTYILIIVKGNMQTYES